MKIHSAFNPIRRLVMSAPLVVAACLWSANEVHAISLNITSIPDNTGVVLEGANTAQRGAVRAILVPDWGGSTPDIVGASVDAATRFIANVGADRPAATSGGTHAGQLNVNYTVNFTVVPDLGVTLYDVFVNHRILGMCGTRDDHSGVGGEGNARMSNVSGWWSVNAGPGFSLPGLNTETYRGPTDSTSGVGTEFSGNTTLFLGNYSGINHFSLTFAWWMRAESHQRTLGADEAGVRLGHSAAIGGCVPCDYPGTPWRTQDLDGHFVTAWATVTYIPEPSALALVGLGVLGLFAIRRFRRG